MGERIKFKTPPKTVWMLHDAVGHWTWGVFFTRKAARDHIALLAVRSGDERAFRAFKFNVIKCKRAS